SPPSGCAFHPRCPSCFAPCKTAYPANDSIIGGSVRCHLHDSPAQTLELVPS
ncbi:ABC transporter ATP-binding protein, partial [Pseudomonas sp. SIMBA_065]